jgi:hypothetical protein
MKTINELVPHDRLKRSGTAVCQPVLLVGVCLF